jgi:uncharacterized protein (DUF1330 family)
LKSLFVITAVVLLLASGATAASKAYVVVEITVTDSAVYEAYKAAIAPLAEKYGGRYLVRAGRVEAIEGAPPNGRVVLFEFPSFDQAMAFERAPETLQASKLRHRSTKSRIFVVEGVAE